MPNLIITKGTKVLEYKSLQYTFIKYLFNREIFYFQESLCVLLNSFYDCNTPIPFVTFVVCID